jgi:ubiquinone biosynthesis protein COQ4
MTATASPVLTATPKSPYAGGNLASAEVADREYHGRKIKPITAIRAFGRLVSDKEDTVQVFEIMKALTGKSTPNGYIKLTRRAGGIAYARPELAQRFSDKAWLAGFKPATVGATYRDFMQAENLSPEELARDNRVVTPFIDAPHVFAWYARRVRDIHDVWHVLTGYGRDALGEACLVAFSYAQTGNLGFGFIGLAGALQIRKVTRGVPALRAVYEAWRNGRKARWLPAEDYEALFAEPLEAARARLGIAQPSVYLSIPAPERARLKFSG